MAKSITKNKIIYNITDDTALLYEVLEELAAAIRDLVRKS